MNVFDLSSEKIGNVAFDIDMRAMSAILKEQTKPFPGKFQIVSHNGQVIMYANTNEIFKRVVPESWLLHTTESHGDFFDKESNKYVYYKAYTNPDWIAYYSVDKSVYDNIFRTEYHLFSTLILICLTFYLIIIFLCRVYFKRMINALYMSSLGLTEEGYVEDFETLYKGISAQHKQLKDAEKTSMIDFLTQLGTRKKLEADVDSLIAQKVQYYLAIIDLDNFKQINDKYGHPVGDVVLKSVALTGLQLLGNKYKAYRFGGEEIVVIFPDCSYNECFSVMDQWRSEISQRSWREQGLKVSFSCGIAQADTDGNLEDALEKADKLLYDAKHSGKNRIIGPV